MPETMFDERLALGVLSLVIQLPRLAHSVCKTHHFTSIPLTPLVKLVITPV